jgi:hypothetical protein
LYPSSENYVEDVKEKLFVRIVEYLAFSDVEPSIVLGMPGIATLAPIVVGESHAP